MVHTATGGIRTHDLAVASPAPYHSATVHQEGDKMIELNSTEEEKDLGVFITKDLKFHEQCVQKAQSGRSAASSLPDRSE